MPKIRISLAAARVNAGMTQESAAARAKISKSTLLKWESGKTDITAAKLNELANIYGIPVDCIRIPEKSTLRE